MKIAARLLSLSSGIFRKTHFSNMLPPKIITKPPIKTYSPFGSGGHAYAIEKQITPCSAAIPLSDKISASTTLVVNRLDATSMVNKAAESVASSEEPSKDKEEQLHDKSRLPFFLFKLLLALIGFELLTEIPTKTRTSHLGHEKGRAIIYTWPLVEGNIGHQAILLLDKMGKPINYMSFWPTDNKMGILQILPFKMVPHPSNFASMESDICNEGQQPYMVHVINDIDLTNALNAVKKIATGTQQDITHYQLFPNIIFVNWMIHYAMNVNRPGSMDDFDPLQSISRTLLESKQKGEADFNTINFKTYNCTSSISYVLYKAGFSVRLVPSICPWEATPLSQAKLIEWRGANLITDNEEIERMVQLAITAPLPLELLHPAEPKADTTVVDDFVSVRPSSAC